jgi:hypothetical protein
MEGSRCTSDEITSGGNLEGLRVISRPTITPMVYPECVLGEPNRNYSAILATLQITSYVHDFT